MTQRLREQPLLDRTLSNDPVFLLFHPILTISLKKVHFFKKKYIIM